MRARAPASSANLGPGFDALAVALSAYVEVEVTPADRLEVCSEGEGSDLPRDHTHLAARVVTSVLGHDRARVRVRSDIPLARGMGSSAALAVAAAAAAGADDPLGVGTEVDGHAENAAASVFGGLVTAAVLDGRPVARPLPLDPDLVFVLLVPDRPLATVEARRVLPSTVSHTDAVFNLGRMGLLIAGLADRTALVAAAAEDRLHQPYRDALFPEAACLIDGVVDAGALAACWSGAGPTLIAICSRQEGQRVHVAGQDLLERAGVAGRALLLEADRDGLQVDV